MAIHKAFESIILPKVRSRVPVRSGRMRRSVRIERKGGSIEFYAIWYARARSILKAGVAVKTWRASFCRQRMKITACYSPQSGRHYAHNYRQGDKGMRWPWQSEKRNSTFTDALVNLLAIAIERQDGNGDGNLRA